MATDHGLITVIPVDGEGDVMIPASFLKSMTGSSRVAFHVKSSDMIIIKAFHKDAGDKVFNAYLEVNPDGMKAAVQWIGKHVPKENLIWTTGFCVPESEKRPGHDACVWQGIVKFPGNPGMTIEDARVFFKGVNLSEDKHVITRTIVEEV